MSDRLLDLGTDFLVGNVVIVSLYEIDLISPLAPLQRRGCVAWAFLIFFVFKRSLLNPSASSTMNLPDALFLFALHGRS